MKTLTFVFVAILCLGMNSNSLAVGLADGSAEALAQGLGIVSTPSHAVVASNLVPIERKYFSTAAWTFPAGSSSYSGSGTTREQAFAEARRICTLSQGLKEYVGFCFNSPTSVQYSLRDYYGVYWSGWVTWGDGVGDPCPDGTTRGNEVGANHRSVDLLPPKPQTNHAFECWGPVIPE